MVAFMPDAILVAVFLFLIVINVYFKLFQDYHPFFDHTYKALIGWLVLPWGEQFATNEHNTYSRLVFLVVCAQLS